MSLLNSCLAKRKTIAAVMILGGVASGAAFAQGGPTLLQQVIALFNELVTDVETLQSSVDALAETSNVKVTPVVWITSGVLDCVATNAADSDRQIATEIVKGNDGSTLVSWPAQTVAPGRVTGVGFFSPSAYSGYASCRFIVSDGTADDIRASLSLRAVYDSDQPSLIVSAE